MTLNAPDVLEYVRSQDIKFIKMSFCDLLGRQKNLSIPAAALSRAFEHGVAFDAASVSGFCGVEASDLYLRPDPSTLAVLPWRPQQGRVARLYCYVDTPSGEPFDVAVE
ncbi:MAG TPA: glutamine synthetase, partial [Clostridia bacterium]|nr:glutamine synthetase [Clostridia bacterium]